MSQMNCEVRDGHRQARIPGPSAERGAERLAGLPADHTPAPVGRVGRVGIIGAGTIGVGIAMRLLDAGIPVTIYDGERTSLDKAMATARSRDRDTVTNGEPAADTRAGRLALLAATLYFHHLKDCDLIIDTVVTEMGVKETLFRRLDEVAKPGAILVTCGASCDVDRLAGFTRRQGEVLGLRFPNPANGMAMPAFVRGRGTSGASMATATALATTLSRFS